jgi:AAA-like domain
MALVGGNPDLVDLALKTIVDESITLDLILSTATTEAGIYRDRLRKLWSVISLKPRLKAAVIDIINPAHGIRIDPLILHQLESLGLVKIEGDRAILRCDLYHQYFSRLLTTENNL